MNIKQHSMNLYQKPKIGTGFIRRLPIYNYRHSINAIGGFDSASCDIALRSIDEMQDFLNQNIGNRIRFFVDNPVEPIWEGFINRMTFNAGGSQYTISLDEMANRVHATYTLSASTPLPTQGATTNDTTSQAIYGIKEETVELGFQTTVGTGATSIRDTRLLQKAYPKTSRIPGGAGGGGLLHIECLGFFHTLEWESYTAAGTGLVAINTMLTTLLAAVANGTTFFDSGDTTGVVANAKTMNNQRQRNQTMWEIMREATEYGDGTSYYVIGISPTNFQTGTRILYYRAFNSAINYTARQSDGLIIRNLYGQKIDPWRVQPDNGVRISDMLVGWNGTGDNPTQTWIKAIDYDANRQLATWRGDDDISAEGAFQFNNYGKAIGKRFGAARRTT